MYLVKMLKGEIFLCLTKPVQKPSRVEPNSYYWSPGFGSGNYISLGKHYSIAEDLAPGEMKEVDLIDMEENLEIPPEIETQDVPDYKELATGDKDDDVPF